jgi:hypothetical protein
MFVGGEVNWTEEGGEDQCRTSLLKRVFVANGQAKGSSACDEKRRLEVKRAQQGR